MTTSRRVSHSYARPPLFALPSPFPTLTRFAQESSIGLALIGQRYAILQAVRSLSGERIPACNVMRISGVSEHPSDAPWYRHDARRRRRPRKGGRRRGVDHHESIHVVEGLLLPGVKTLMGRMRHGRLTCYSAGGRHSAVTWTSGRGREWCQKTSGEMLK